ncbi:SDR family NAD(P)-dependent oxidoreductase [Streptomyces wuyuanensis]|uniref:SDR family NAD(P)-dependent oxidoreductase n=1 Tax=Streptomyces wuyuanensis TaxID=1196353 RepID=UPI003798C85B
MAQRWLVTGCSSGLGYALADAAAQAGHRVAVTARRTDALDGLARAWPGRVTPLAMELRNAAQCAEAVHTASGVLGGIDVLVNNAGGGLFGTVEELCDDEVRDQLEPWSSGRGVSFGSSCRSCGPMATGTSSMFPRSPAGWPSRGWPRTWPASTPSKA